MIDNDSFSFENLSRHILDNVFFSEQALAYNKVELIKERIKRKFGFNIDIINEKIDYSNFYRNILNRIDENTIIINCTGELYMTSLIFNGIKNENINNLYISSLFFDDEFDWNKNEEMFFIKNSDVSKMAIFCERWGKSKSVQSKYLCTRYNEYSILEIFLLVSKYVKYFLEKICL